MKTRPFTAARSIFLVLTLALGAVAGCGDKPDAAADKPATTSGATGAKGTGAAKPTAKAEVQPAAWAFKNLDKLGAKMELPADATVSDSSGDAPGVSIFNNKGDFTVDVNVTTAAHPSTFAAAKKDVEKDPNKFQKFTVEKETPDGWHLEYELESMIDKKPLYGVQIRKKIGDKSIQCGRNVREEAGRASAAKACTSLTKM
jgi:hypothetical protein